MSFLARIRPRTKPRRFRLKGKDLTDLRNKCFERDWCVCQECKRECDATASYERDHSAHMAHIQAKRRGGDSLPNVRTLCGKCHRLEHAGGKVVPAKEVRKEEMA